MKESKQIPFENYLVHKDSTVAFVHFYCRKKYLRQLRLKRPIMSLAYRIGLISSYKFYRLLLQDLLMGMSKDKFERVAAEFAATVLDRQVCMPNVTAVMQKKAAGETFVVQSTGLEAWVKPWCNKMGIEHVDAYHAVVDDRGILTGEITK